MDYAFAPGNTSQDGRVRRMFQRRSGTTLVAANRSRTSVRDFINHLNTTASVPKPVGNLLLGTHADARGHLNIPMYSEQSGPTKYENLEDTITNPDYSISVPDSLIDDSPDDPVDRHIHIKGCNIGKATTFLEKLKEAAGGNLHVTAPLHFHDIYQLSGLGTWEHMSYEFRITRPDAFAGRDALIDALVLSSFSYYDADPVSREDWEKLVPRRIGRSSSKVIRLPLGSSIGRRTTIPGDQVFRYRISSYSYTIEYPSASDIPPKAGRLAALDSALDDFKYRETDTTGGFDPAHPYPEYERWGYSSKQDFLDGHTWRFSVNGRVLLCRGRVHIYTLIVPLTSRVAGSEGDLIFNFYPLAGSGLSPVAGGLEEDDAALFATV